MTRDSKECTLDQLEDPILRLEDAVFRLRRTHKLRCTLHGLKQVILSDRGPHYVALGTKLFISQPSLDKCARAWCRNGAPQLLSASRHDLESSRGWSPIDIN